VKSRRVAGKLLPDGNNDIDGAGTKGKPRIETKEKNGGPSGIRTQDQLVKSHPLNLSQLIVIKDINKTVLPALGVFTICFAY